MDIKGSGSMERPIAITYVDEEKMTMAKWYDVKIFSEHSDSCD